MKASLVCLLFMPALNAVNADLSQAEKIATCNRAMLNDFEGMSQEAMMECASLLEDPLLKLEEETKAKEAAEREAKLRAKEEAARKAAVEEERKKKAEEAAAAVAKAKAEERDRQAAMVSVLKSDLSECEGKYASAVTAGGSLDECMATLKVYEDNYVPVDPRIKPLFGSRNVETVVAPLVAALTVIFWLLGCCVGSSRTTAYVNPTAASKSGVRISRVVIEPGNEVCFIQNRSFADVDLTGCSLRVADHIYHFDDGYNLAKGTTVEIHAGPGAKEIKKIPVADHDKFDSRRCPQLFWTSASVFLGSGETTAALYDASEHQICASS